ncbi:MAG: alpha/beta fold hydrolase [Acidimicrobiales bacterium]
MRTSEQLAARCRADGEFCLAARHWNGGLRFDFGEAVAAVTITDGEAVAGDPGDGHGVITLSGPAQTWAEMLVALPARFANDISPARALGVRRTGDELVYWQYAPAIQRAVELLREPSAEVPAVGTIDETRPPGSLEAAVGRYVHLELGGADHRVYFEEAGGGIPLLCQHTAGSHGTQWRHVLANPAITENFRVIAYDLPFHGKSLPPVGQPWWETQYKLDGEFLRSVPVALAAALDLDQPVFMGCSVGGLLALDLAARHGADFQAVISVEGALTVDGNWDDLLGFWHPQVSNESKARMMEGLTAPSSPVEYRKETIQTYASGWPPAFLGDLWYYLVDYDLTELASTIDTGEVGVHILNGEYDYSATVEMGRAASDAIPGSTFTPMKGIGHFPMSENPNVFFEHLLPILDVIRSDRAGD